VQLVEKEWEDRLAALLIEHKYHKKALDEKLVAFIVEHMSAQKHILMQKCLFSCPVLSEGFV
jgi:hypothetical protein